MWSVSQYRFVTDSSELHWTGVVGTRSEMVKSLHDLRMYRYRQVQSNGAAPAVPVAQRTGVI